MRVLVLLFAVVTCMAVGMVAVPLLAAEPGDAAVSTALEAELTVVLPDHGSLPETALSLVEDLREIANLEGLQLQLDLSDGVLAASLRARFTFASLAELSEWKDSEDVRRLLGELAQASGQQPQLRVRGNLMGE